MNYVKTRPHQMNSDQEILNSNVTITIYDILQNDNGFNMFARTHNISDTTNGNCDDGNYIFDKLIEINLPDSSPTLVICNKSNEITQIQQCINIYNKYIVISTPICINISGVMRNDIANKITNVNNLDNSELLHIWDECRYQIFGDLENAFQRFQE
eukprot:254922_1